MTKSDLAGRSLSCSICSYHHKYTDCQCLHVVYLMPTSFHSSCPGVVCGVECNRVSETRSPRSTGRAPCSPDVHWDECDSAADEEPLLKTDEVSEAVCCSTVGREERVGNMKVRCQQIHGTENPSLTLAVWLFKVPCFTHTSYSVFAKVPPFPTNKRWILGDAECIAVLKTTGTESKECQCF